jgi:uncharacterized protein (TIGR03382 family)
LACAEVEYASGDPGARNFSVEFQELEVCAPPPPSCPEDGWLEELPVTRAGVDCGDGPDPSWFEIPPAPDCSSGDGSDSSSSASTVLVNAASNSASDSPEEEDDAPNTTKPRSASGDDDADAANSDDGGFCSVGVLGQPSAPPMWSLLLLGVALLRRRRSA